MVTFSRYFQTFYLEVFMRKSIVYTAISKEIVENLSKKCSLFNQYNSNVGAFFSSFYQIFHYHMINNKQWNGKQQINYSEKIMTLFDKKTQPEIFSTMYDEKILKKYQTAKINKSSNTYQIIVPGFYEDTDYHFAQIKNKTLLKRIDLYQTRQYEQLPASYKIHSDHLKYFELDYNEANNRINYLFDYTDFFVKKAIEKNTTPESLLKAYKIQNESYSIDDNVLKKDAVGRGYQKNTNINSISRNYIAINGDTKTANIDIKTSQPRFFAIWLSQLPDYKTNSLFKKELDKYFLDVLNDENKDIYLSWDSLKNYDRSIAKTHFFQYFIFRYWKNPNSNFLLDAIISKCPELIKIIKRETHNKPHNYIPLMMQHIESNFIYNKVTPLITKYLPEEKFNAIHDSIFCRGVVAEEIQIIMQVSFADTFKQPLISSIDYYNNTFNL
jgi:hypothetical protein